MTMECSPELADMVRRCALPISVEPGRTQLWIFRKLKSGGYVYVANHASAAAASRAYFDLVATFPNSLPPTAALAVPPEAQEAGTATGGTAALAAPVALSSRSTAAQIPADSTVDAAEVPPIANASAAPSIVGGL